MNNYYESESIVENYAKYWPRYSQQMAEIIVEYINKHSNRGYGTMVDVACGSGQCTQLLGPYFNQVYAYDVSRRQIEKAKHCHGNKGYRFEVGAAESIPVDDESVDLVTCACAAHWLDYEKFMAETWRVLKPGGVVAPFTYFPGRFADDTGKTGSSFCVEANKLLTKFYQLCRPKPAGIKHCNNRYDVIYDDCWGINKESDTSVLLINHCTLGGVVGYFKSYDGYESYVKYTKEQLGSFEDKHDILKHFADGVKVLLGKEGVDNDDVKVIFTYETRIIMSTKPTD